jgi:hypothetical protein
MNRVIVSDENRYATLHGCARGDVGWRTTNQDDVACPYQGYHFVQNRGSIFYVTRMKLHHDKRRGLIIGKELAHLLKGGR